MCEMADLLHGWQMIDDGAVDVAAGDVDDDGDDDGVLTE